MKGVRLPRAILLPSVMLELQRAVGGLAPSPYGEPDLSPVEAEKLAFLLLGRAAQAPADSPAMSKYVAERPALFGRMGKSRSDNVRNFLKLFRKQARSKGFPIDALWLADAVERALPERKEDPA